MTSTLSNPRQRRDAGFSLVEVTLALAIIAVGMIAILGLLPQGIQSSRDAADNTISATIVQDIFNSLRSDSFTSSTILTNAFSFQPTSSFPLNLRTYDTTSGDPVLFACFDKSGFSVPSTSPDRYFQIRLEFQPQGSLALSRVIAKVVWPALSAAPINTNIFTTEVAQY